MKNVIAFLFLATPLTCMAMQRTDTPVNLAKLKTTAANPIEELFRKGIFPFSLDLRFAPGRVDDALRAQALMARAELLKITQDTHTQETDPALYENAQMVLNMIYKRLAQLDRSGSSAESTDTDVEDQS